MRIHEILKEDATDYLGNVAFGSVKNDPEKDTSWEADALNRIIKFIKSSAEENQDDLMKIAPILKQLKTKYPNDLIPNAKIAYRGSQANALYDKLAAKLDTLPKVIEIDYTYTATGMVQSWSVDMDTAVSFATSGDSDQSNTSMHDYWSRWYPAPIILKANVDDSFIFNADLINMISQTSLGVQEHEIIRFGHNPLKCKILVYKHWVENYKRTFIDDGE